GHSSDRGRERDSWRAALPLSSTTALLLRGPSRFHKCPVRQSGSRLGSKMSSWVQLLLALLATCLRFGAAE
ncbi:hypothetical protein KUCAC02_007395, partial [Chaenocephalus aceratus]